MVFSTTAPVTSQISPLCTGGRSPPAAAPKKTPAPPLPSRIPKTPRSRLLTPPATRPPAPPRARPPKCARPGRGLVGSARRGQCGIIPLAAVGHARPGLSGRRRRMVRPLVGHHAIRPNQPCRITVVVQPHARHVLAEHQQPAGRN